jgi:hypothetical protein
MDVLLLALVHEIVVLTHKPSMDVPPTSHSTRDCKTPLLTFSLSLSLPLASSFLFTKLLVSMIITYVQNAHMVIAWLYGAYSGLDLVEVVTTCAGAGAAAAGVRRVQRKQAGTRSPGRRSARVCSCHSGIRFFPVCSRKAIVHVCRRSRSG